MDAKKLALLCRKLADNKKAEDILVMDVRKISSVTDYFVLASGNNEPHLRAIADEIADGVMREAEAKPRATDGSLAGGWLVMDFFDVIVHVMRGDVRQRYDLESLWGDAPKVRIPAGSTSGSGSTAAAAPGSTRKSATSPR
jgi:ribosome-associated protein